MHNLVSNLSAIYPHDIPFKRKEILWYSSARTPYIRKVPYGMPQLGRYREILIKRCVNKPILSPGAELLVLPRVSLENCLKTMS